MMRSMVIACAIIVIIILSQVSEFCYAGSDTIEVIAENNTVDISNMRFRFRKMGTCTITLGGSWFYNSTNEDPQNHVVSYYRLGESEANKSEILVVGEGYNWTIQGGYFLYLYFPDPGDISDNHGNITLYYRYSEDPKTHHGYRINVNASENSVSFANITSHEFPRGGEYELVISGEWYNETGAPQNYTLAYYSGSVWIEKLVEGSTYLWEVSEGASVYFFLPYIGIGTSEGQISIEISEMNPPEDQMWCLAPVWIGIWLTIVSIIIGIISIMVARKRR